MRYYLVTIDPCEDRLPEVLDWNENVPISAFYQERTWEIKFRNLLNIKDTGWEPRYLKILLSPLPLVNESLLPVFELYGFHGIQKQMIFLDRKRSKAELYFLLQLKRIASKLEPSAGRMVMKCKSETIVDVNAFYVMDGRKCHLICSLPLVESLILQGLVGVNFTNVEMEWR